MARVLITGGSSGIGLELAKLFVQNGHDLFIVARNEDKLDRAVDLLLRVAAETQGDRDVTIQSLAIDLSDPEAAEDVVDEALANGQPIDILVNNAGAGVYGDFTRETDLEAELDSIAVNVVAPVILTKFIAQEMVRRGQGKILFTASVVSVAPAPNLLVYSATKAFIYHFAEGLRQELKDSGISVTALLPGATDTEFFRRTGMAEPQMSQEGSKGLGLDDPADVARAGYEALMNGDAHVVVSLKNKLQIAAAKFLPMETAAKLGTAM